MTRFHRRCLLKLNLPLNFQEVSQIIWSKGKIYFYLWNDGSTERDMMKLNWCAVAGNKFQSCCIFFTPLSPPSLLPCPSSPPHLEFNELTERSQRHSVPHCCDWGGGSVWCVSVWMEAVRFWCGRDTFVEGVLVLKLVMGRHDVRVTRLVELWYQLQPHRHVVTSVVALDVWVASCTRCLKNPHSSLSFC